MSSQTLEQKPVPPRISQTLVIREDSRPGLYVVKDLATGAFFHVGEEEHYLFSQVDGRRNGADICTAFEARFQEPLSTADLQDFVELASRRGLLEDPNLAAEQQPAGSLAAGTAMGNKSTRKNTLLNWRLPFFDPDRLLGWLEPHLRFVWTRGFVGVTLAVIFLAAVVAAANRAHWISAFPETITLSTVALVWTLICIVTLIHEFAHGLTCKHHGGEVREIGFLLLFFMPCFYCNVSDAWLFRERSKRLWVGAAGTYSDLVIWALATLLWRISAPETSVNYFAWMIATVCGGRCFFNCMPLLKLDGYYFLSDAMRIPNLYDRGRKRWTQTVQWLLWGRRRPKPEPRGTFIFCYGLASWLFVGTILWGMVYGLVKLYSQGSMRLGMIGVVFSVLMPIVIGKNLLRGLSAGEFGKMLTKRNRRGRVVLWLLALIGFPALLCVIPIQDRVAGNFTVRPATRMEINAAEAGFLRDIRVAEGSQVSAGTPIARIEIPDLEVNLTKKLAEIRESKANLRRLEAGPRPEEVAEQRLRVERALDWVALGKQDLHSAQQAYDQEIVQLEQQIQQQEAESEFSKLSLAHAEKLHQQKALSGEQLQSDKTKFKIAQLKLDYARAQKRTREAESTVAAASELAGREKELADERSKLTLLEAGGRPEEADAERARLARLTEEHKYLEHLRSRVVLRSPVPGTITTPHMHEKDGQYVPTGTVVCIVEDLSDVVAEIAVSESTVLKVEPGQLVELRARGMPLRTFHAKVERTAPAAATSTSIGISNIPGPVLPGNVTVYCRLSQADAELLSGMTGYARIYGEQKTIGRVAHDRLLRYLRTEFWLW